MIFLFYKFFHYDVSVLNLLNGLIGSGAGASAKGVTGTALNGISSITDAVAAFRDDPARDPSTGTIPRASLNWILFDEQFRPVSGAMGFNRVTTANTLEDLKELNIAIPKNGYLYVYCSNESPTAVFFDNVQVVHDRGQVLEETHYYPFGLEMAGVSSKAASIVENRYKFNDATEFTSDFDINLYETPYRGYDPQLGRFHQIDALADKFSDWNPYTFGYDNPITYNDPSGLESIEEFMRKALAGNGGTWKKNDKFKGGGSSFYYGADGIGGDEGSTAWGRSDGSISNVDGFYSSLSANVSDFGFWDMLETVPGPYKDFALPAMSFINHNLNPVYLGFNGINSQFTGQDFLSGEEMTRTEGVVQIASSVPVGKVLGLLFGKIGAFLGKKVVVNAVSEGVQYSDELVKTAQKLYPKLAGKTHLHHPIPQYLGGAKNQVLVPLDAAYHQQITNAFRAEWGYGIGTPTAAQLETIMNKVYSQFPLPK